MVSNLIKKINSWLSAGLISPEQHQKILAHEEKLKNSSWILIGFYILGISILSMGVVSLIAANWQKISSTVKLSTMFLGLGTVGLALFRSYIKERKTTFEILLILFYFLHIASIGLVAQIFHLKGEYYQTLVFWSLSCLGIMLFSNRLYLPLLWAIFFFSGLVETFAYTYPFDLIFQEQFYYIWAWLPLLTALIFILFNKYDKESVQTKVFRWMFISLTIICLMFLDYKAFSHDLVAIEFKSMIPFYLTSLILLFLILKDKLYSSIQKFIMSIIYLLYFLFSHIALLTNSSKFQLAINNIGILLLLAVLMISLKKSRWFQFFLLILGLRFLGLYQQAFGGLLKTGYGLVFSGFLIIACGYLWHKYKTRLEQQLSRYVGE